MGVLIDANIFIHNLCDEESIRNASEANKIKLNKSSYITDIVNKELVPGKGIKGENRIKAKRLLKDVIKLKKSRDLLLIKINPNKDYKDNYELIYKRYYWWVNDPEYIKNLYQNRTLTIPKNKLKFLGRGECSCVAVAMTNPQKYLIVSSDKGYVESGKIRNIFNECAAKYKIQKKTFEEWKIRVKFEMH